MRKQVLCAIVVFPLCVYLKLDTPRAMLLTIVSLFFFPVIDEYGKARAELELEEQAKQSTTIPRSHATDSLHSPRFPSGVASATQRASSPMATPATAPRLQSRRLDRRLFWGLLISAAGVLAFILYLVLYYFPYVF